MASQSTPVVFVHGLWLHASSWDSWVTVFDKAGYAPTAPGWPGDSDTVEECRATPDSIAGHGIDDVVNHYAAISRPSLPSRSSSATPSAVSSCSDCWAEGHATAAVAIDPAPIKGVVYLPPSALRVASVALRNPANKKKAVSLNEKQFRYGFGNAVSDEESKDLFDKWTIPSPGQAALRGGGGQLLAAAHRPRWIRRTPTEGRC